MLEPTSTEQAGRASVIKQNKLEGLAGSTKTEQAVPSRPN